MGYSSKCLKGVQCQKWQYAMTNSLKYWLEMSCTYLCIYTHACLYTYIARINCTLTHLFFQLSLYINAVFQRL